MYKKLLAFVAGAVFSAGASAGYIQYDFIAPAGYDQSGVSGYFIQRDDDQAIAYFYLTVYDPKNNFGTVFQPNSGEGGTSITSETTHYHGDGPTSFTIGDNYGEDHDAHFNVEFSPTTDGNFSYLSTYSYQLYDDGFGWWHAPKRSGAVSGLVTKGTVSPGMANELDMMGGTHYAIPHIVPAYTHFLPEPASLGLLAVGALGVGVARRRKAVR